MSAGDEDRLDVKPPLRTRVLQIKRRSGESLEVVAIRGDEPRVEVSCGGLLRHGVDVPVADLASVIEALQKARTTLAGA